MLVVVGVEAKEVAQLVVGSAEPLRRGEAPEAAHASDAAFDAAMILFQAIVMGWPAPFSCGARLAGQPEGRELIRCRSQFWGSTWARTAAASWVWTPAGGWSCGDA